jgi:hypothetical protein
MSLVILTADELIALDVESKGGARRAARETPTATRILRMFLDRGIPIPVEDIVTHLERDGAASPHDALVSLDDEDLIRISNGYVDLAYPFSASPTPFLVRFKDARERHVCCAVDALGIASMVGEPVEIRARCHHSGTPLTFVATPEGPERAASGIMLWVGKRTEERCRGIDGL